MRGLTKRELRAFKRSINESNFDRKKLRIIVDCKRYDGFYILGLTCLDGVISQRICMPFKDAPSVNKIMNQLKHITPSVSPAMV